jgi:hypothetical protein
MKTKLHNCGRLEVRQSSIEGYGVFATEEIKQGEILEEIPFILFPQYTALGKNFYEYLDASNLLKENVKTTEFLRKNLKFKEPEKYYFKWSPPEPNINGENITYCVLPLGFGPIYNSSNTENNAGWQIDDNLFTFIAEKDIQKDEEVRTFYGYFLGDDGSIWNADQVFFFGMDKDGEGKVRLKSLRFNSQEAVEKSKKDTGFSMLQSILAENNKGVVLKKINGITTTGEKKFSFEFPEYYPLRFFYAKINEFKRSTLPMVEFSIENPKEKTIQSIVIKNG